MPRINLWFNRTFGTAYHIIQELRASQLPFEFTIYGTHVNSQSVFLQACDHAEIEPYLPPDEYVAYALDFCKRYAIDVFFPGELSAHIIADNRQLFEEAGIKLFISASSETMNIIKSKAATYKALAHIPGLIIPEYYLASTPAEFEFAYQQLVAHGKTACFKPDVSQGGLGFRIIQNSINPFEDLLGYPSPNNTFEHFFGIIRQQESFPAFIVMEYLPGEEYSIDCLAHEGELLFGIPRKKIRNLRIIEPIPKLEAMSAAICQSLDLSLLSNIQFRYNSQQVACLLEINARFSGGLFYANKAGYPLMTHALQLMLTGKTSTLPPLTKHVFAELDDAVSFKPLETLA